MHDPASNFPQYESTVRMKGSSIVSSCRICLSTILDAAALPCGHRFCESCLKQYWRHMQKPICLDCPLCRSTAFDINFAKKGNPSSESFRNMFNDMENLPEMPLCLKISILVPTVYFLFKFLKEPVVQFIAYLNWKMMPQV